MKAMLLIVAMAICGVATAETTPATVQGEAIDEFAPQTLEEAKAQIASYRREIAAMQAEMAKLSAEVKALRAANSRLPVAKPSAPAAVQAPVAQKAETVVFADIIASMPPKIASNPSARGTFISEKTKGKLVTVTGKVVSANDRDIVLHVKGGRSPLASEESKTGMGYVKVVLKQPLTAEQIANAQGKVTTLTGLCQDGAMTVLWQQ